MNIFKQFYKSIYSPKDIALFRFQGIGKTILFVFFLTFISILPTIIYLSTALSTGIETANSIIKEKAPDFSIKNGQLSAKTDIPFTINKDNFTVIIDPTGAISETDVKDAGNTLALLKNEIALASGGGIDTYQYSMLGADLTKSDMINIVDTISNIKGIIIPLMSVLIYLFASASSFIEVSILALFGLALKNLLGRKLNYGQLWRMAAYSETLPTLFFTIMTAIKTSVPNSSLLNWFVVMLVLFLTIKEVPKPKKSN